MTLLKVLQHLRQLLLGHVRSKREHPVHNMIRPRLVGSIEVARFGRGLEGAHYDARRVGPQEQIVLTQQSHQRRACSGGGIVRLPLARASARISASPSRYETTDSPPLFSFARSGCNPSLQLPVSTSTSGRDKSLLPRNQANARSASAFHLGSPSAAARQAEMVAAASSGC